MGFPLLLGARSGVGRPCVGRGWVCLVPGKGTKLQRSPTVANVSLWECGTSKELCAFKWSLLVFITGWGIVTASLTVAPAARWLLKGRALQFQLWGQCMCALQPRVGRHRSQSKASSV